MSELLEKISAGVSRRGVSSPTHAEILAALESLVIAVDVAELIRYTRATRRREHEPLGAFTKSVAGTDVIESSPDVRSDNKARSP